VSLDKAVASPVSSVFLAVSPIGGRPAFPFGTGSHPKNRVRIRVTLTSRIEGASSRSHSFQFRPITGLFKKFRTITIFRGKIWTNHKFPWEIPTNYSPLLEYEGVMKEIWRKYEETWRNYEGIRWKYEGNIRGYEEICLGPFSLNQSGASISLDQSEASVSLSTN